MFDQAGSEKVEALVNKAKQKNVKVVLPVDYVTADKFAKDAEVFCRINYIFICLPMLDVACY